MKKDKKPKGTKIHMQGSVPVIVPEDFKPKEQKLRKDQ